MGNKKGLDRRQFIGIAWVASILALAAQATNAFVKFMTPELEPGAFGTRVRAGELNEFEVGSVHFFREGRFFLVRLEEGFLALYRKCTHLGCAVPWDEELGKFNCPCHSSLFNKKGEVLSGPAPRPLDYFPAEIVGDEVFVDTGRLMTRREFDETQVARV
ncbi:MAG: ubiquinol-cytochrome c reductase iron-sulfur subunit [Anaerolineae bacterium]